MNTWSELVFFARGCARRGNFYEAVGLLNTALQVARDIDTQNSIEALRQEFLKKQRKQRHQRNK